MSSEDLHAWYKTVLDCVPDGDVEECELHPRGHRKPVTRPDDVTIRAAYVVWCGGDVIDPDDPERTCGLGRDSCWRRMLRRLFGCR
ncbi:hypothetical protein ACFQX7_31600 [Luedemannella flava]